MNLTVPVTENAFININLKIRKALKQLKVV